MNYSLKKTKTNVKLALLLSIMTILTFTPFGFIVIPPIAITILHIPVIIGAITMGLNAGLFLGFCFGVLSLTKATFFAVSPVDILFSPFLSGYPIKSILLSIVTRLLFGFFAGVIFIFLSRHIKNTNVCIIVTTIVSSALHTIMVLGLLSVFFEAIPLKEVFLTIITFNGILEILVAVVVCLAVCKPLLKIKN